MSRSTAILVALASLLLLTWATVAMRHGVIEDDLAGRVQRELAAYAIDGLEISAVGRDLPKFLALVILRLNDLYKVQA